MMRAIFYAILLFLFFAAPHRAQTIQEHDNPDYTHLSPCSPAEARSFLRAARSMQGMNAAGYPYDVFAASRQHTGLTGDIMGILAEGMKPLIEQIDQWIESYL